MESALVAFRLVKPVNGKYLVLDDMPSGQLRDNLLHVLTYYEVPHAEGAAQQQGERAILIERDTAADVEMVYNYILKAKDRAWMSDHPL